MATTITSAVLRNQVLESLGVVGAGQSASAEDGALVDKAILSAWYRLRRKRVAQYALSAIPEALQTPLTDYIAAEVAHRFGLSGQVLADIRALKQAAFDEMSAFYQAEDPNIPVKADYF